MKDYRLFKRDDKGNEMSPTAEGYRERDYYFRFVFRKKAYLRCLETNDAELAQRFAKNKAAEIKEAVIRGDLKKIADTKLRLPAAAPFSELKAVYQTSAVDASADTRNQNILGMSLVLRTVYGIENADNVSVSQINSHCARRWFELAKQKVEAEPDQSAQKSIKVSANSRMAQAVSMLTARAVATYKDADIYQDCFEQFRQTYHAFKFTGVTDATYAPPSDKIIAATLAAWEKLTDRNMFLVIGHELAFGLRKGEISQARWGWWQTRSGYPVLDSTALEQSVHVKNRTGIIQVRALDPWFNIMRARVDAEGWRGQPDEFIVTGNNSNREDSIFRAVSQWLRGLGWDTNKTNHALRAYAGSQIAMKYGIYEAQTWLRHSTVKVTEDHYTQFIKRFKPSNPDALPARWAVTAEGWTPRVLDKAEGE